MDLGYAPVEMEIAEVTRQDQKPPEAPKKVDMAVVSDMLQVVTNDTKIETEIDFAEFDMNQAIEVAPRPDRGGFRRGDFHRRGREGFVHGR